ncbi:Protein O-mannosyl-transferase TMTC2 like protein [Argiope bruennichi]|uniref:Protein O-mannosyl-transferase TMTC2 like protein n=1 Tax=Argiope bruennichi TaxID=94029 RepID=A0A8T0EMU6_ARGBR|nr:Protein O-mannosyl-transferase TMTC2 like protein [Argiope bruennichi]
MAGRNARALNHRSRETGSSLSSANRSHRLQTGRSTTTAAAVVPAMEYYYAIIATVSGLSMVLYWNTLGADFAYDDSRAIKTNQDLLPSTPIGQLFFNDFWGTPLTHSGSHKSYRPLCVLTFRLNYALGGFDPWGYHFFNVVLHTLVSALFTHFASAIFCHNPLPTLVAGLLFAAHPIHTEAIAGIVGRADVGACLFFLFALLSYMRYCKYRDKKVFLYASVAMSAASMLTKEHGVTVLVVCAVYDLFVVHRLHPKDFLVIFNQELFITSFVDKLQMQQLKAVSVRKFIVAHLNLGLVLGILGRREEAADVYRHCAEREPMDRHREAEQWFLKAKVIAPNDSSVFQHYAQFLSENERHAEAGGKFNTPELGSRKYEIVFNAANALRKAGRNEEAEHYYKIAVKLRPSKI